MADDIASLGTVEVLTPIGYQSPVALANGAEVCAFDAVTGAPIINHVENIDVVDYTEWCRWWQVGETVLAFNWIRVNGTFLLFGEQSVWRNGTNVCHAKHLVVGDEIYDDTDHAVAITSIEVVEDNSLIWYRFDISGDHSYIIDGLTVHNASRFWVGGTGTWDSSTTTHWAASTGGAGSQSVPGSADSVTFDGSSGGGTVTLNFGGAITIQSITMGAFTGTWDNSVNNNDMALSAVGGFQGTGTGTRTINLGTATYTLSASNAQWFFSTTLNLTYTGSAANIVFTGSSGARLFTGGGLSHGNVTFGASSGAGIVQVGSSNTLASLNIAAPNYVTFAQGSTTTITGAFNWSGSSSSQIGIVSNSPGGAASFAAASSSVASWCAFRDINFTTGSPVASSSFDLGNNSGITITPPSGHSFGVIGS